MDESTDMAISVEKFAAFLDGNLTNREMLEVEMLIEANEELKDLVSLSEIVDADIYYYANNDLECNFDVAMIDSNGFELPYIGEGIMDVEQCTVFNQLDIMQQHVEFVTNNIETELLTSEDVYCHENEIAEDDISELQ